MPVSRLCQKNSNFSNTWTSVATQYIYTMRKRNVSPCEDRGRAWDRTHPNEGTERVLHKNQDRRLSGHRHVVRRTTALVQTGLRWPSEKKVIRDPLTGTPAPTPDEH